MAADEGGPRGCGCGAGAEDPFPKHMVLYIFHLMYIQLKNLICSFTRFIAHRHFMTHLKTSLIARFWFFERYISHISNLYKLLVARAAGCAKDSKCFFLFSSERLVGLHFFSVNLSACTYTPKKTPVFVVDIT